MNVRLREFTTDDLPIIEQWLHADHVRSTWRDPDVNIGPLLDSQDNWHLRAVIEADGREVGLVLWQHPHAAGT